MGGVYVGGVYRVGCIDMYICSVWMWCVKAGVFTCV